MEQAVTYKFSKGIHQAKKRYVTLSILLPVTLTVFLFLGPTTRDESLGFKVGIGFFSFIFIGLIFYFTSSKVLRKLSELSVHISPDKIERESNQQKEVFFWQDLQDVKILEYPNGEIVSISLVFRSKKLITLFGFEDMEAAIKQITQYISDQSSIHRKRAKINWDNPAIMIFSVILPSVIILAIQEIGEKAFYISSVVSSLTFGLYSLISRPISRAQGKGWEKFETVIGVILIICSVLLLAVILFAE